MNKKQIETFVKFKLSTSKKWCLKALKVLVQNQTNEELTTQGQLLESNGKGFTKVDSEFLTSIWFQYNSKKFLSDKQFEMLFKTLPKYHNQIVLESKSNKKFDKLKFQANEYFLNLSNR